MYEITCEKNTLGAIPKIIAKYRKLPNAEKYTGHTFRRTSATPGSGADITSLKRHCEAYGRVPP